MAKNTERDSTQNEYALIVAGGKGTRFKSKLPKQFLELRGKPILLHTLEAFYRYSESIKIILVLPESDFSTWNEISNKYKFKKSLTLQAGGDSRFQSVKKGLETITGEGLVAIHDAVRPLVTEDLIRKSFQLAGLYQSAVAAVKLKESLRMAENDFDLQDSKAVDRSKFWLIQTPQTFAIKLIQQAYTLPEAAGFTDDAGVAERSGIRPRLFEGSYDNIKITTPEDMVIAEALLNLRKRL
ncbi:MAG: 2-C-methyl-D-erythritol 4-phosphate cytidylyltransferase [Cyclobacteriaceae bacterium]